MGSEPKSGASATGTFFNALERLVLFALSLAVGLLNLLIALVVAAHLGVIPKKAAARVTRLTNQAADFVTKVMGEPHPASSKPKKKAKP